MRRDLIGGVRDALLLFPPFYVSSVLGPPRTWRWPPGSRYSEFGILDPWQWPRLLHYLGDIFIPSVPRTPPAFSPPLLQPLFFHPSRVLHRGDHYGSEMSHPDEAWFFINGIMTNSAVARMNADYLAYLFHRPITLIQNSTGGVLDDLIECALDKAFWTTGEAATKAFPALYDALTDAKKKHVVLIAHSQGTIIASVLLGFMKVLGSKSICRGPELVDPADEPLDPCHFRKLKPKEINKLEIYCFGNCATSMKYISKYNGKRVPWIESYGNEFDIVARLGVLAPNPKERGVEIDGPRYVRKGAWGHLLNEHYLRPIELAQKEGWKRGARDAKTACPYELLNDNEFKGPPRLYRYINGQPIP